MQNAILFTSEGPHKLHAHNGLDHLFNIYDRIIPVVCPVSVVRPYFSSFLTQAIKLIQGEALLHNMVTGHFVDTTTTHI